MSDIENESQEIREQRRLRRLGTSRPICCVCGETDSRCMELHHIAGQNNDPDTTIIICRNCHRKASDDQLDHPADASPEERLTQIAHFMWGLADFLALAVQKLREYAEVLFAYETPSDKGDAK